MSDHPSLFESATLLNSAPEPEGAPARCSDEEEPKPKTFTITVERQITQTHIFEIEAETADEARELAEDEFPNIDPDDWNLDYEEEPEIKKVVEVSDADELEEAGGGEEGASTANS